jgi:predicted transcriptional regulator
MTTREIAKSVIEAMPEDASLDDIMRALYIRAKIERAERSIDEGRGVPQAEVKKRLQKWLK